MPFMDLPLGATLLLLLLLLLLHLRRLVGQQGGCSCPTVCRRRPGRHAAGLTCMRPLLRSYRRCSAWSSAGCGAAPRRLAWRRRLHGGKWRPPAAGVAAVGLWRRAAPVEESAQGALELRSH